ncbi:PREDICTED: matrilysin-like, partial [Vollenhovia emeryi]|uniref:matrilysin-like n=1 Tax=Vollenhovia emeryi TaxID=411798 RepID=UPI0005F56DAD
MTTMFARIIVTCTVATMLICVYIVAECKVIKNNNEVAIQYLQKYGFLNETMDTFATSEDQLVLRHAINLFQEYYRLPVTGTVDNATLSLMSKPRCGLRDILHFGEGKVIPKWPKRHLTWNFHWANRAVLDTTQAAFDLWQKHSSLTFERAVENPNILISLRKGHHMFLDRRNGELCSSALDGPGGTLAHAFYPNGAPDFTSEVHVDKTEQWYIYLDVGPQNKYNLLYVLTHEIGHSLGLDHSHDTTSIMYSFIPDSTFPVTLNTEDIINIQNLYGATDTDVLPKTTPRPPPPPPPPPPPQPTPSVPPDLCALKRVDVILLLEQRMYVAYGQHIWVIDIDGKTYREPLLLSHYMPFIHSNFTRISAAYQTPSDHLILFVDDKIYKVNYPDFTLVPTWPRTLKDFGIPMDAKIDAAVNTNKG